MFVLWYHKYIMVGLEKFWQDTSPVRRVTTNVRVDFF